MWNTEERTTSPETYRYITFQTHTDVFCHFNTSVQDNGKISDIYVYAPNYIATLNFNLISHLAGRMQKWP